VADGYVKSELSWDHAACMEVNVARLTKVPVSEHLVRWWKKFQAEGVQEMYAVGVVLVAAWLFAH
jgi:hypothetical protein